jgi:hypothetical protein
MTLRRREGGAQVKRLQPRYPIYIPTKGRADLTDYNSTAMYFKKEGVPFHCVVEPQEFDAYAARYGEECVLALPFSNLGLGSIPARNWLWEHAKSIGAERHWCIDDNIWGFVRMYKDRRIPCESGLALRVCEDFTDRYENVAISGLNYRFFGGVPGLPPFFKNVHVYSCILINTNLPETIRWRGRYNEDTDLCLQALATGEWCTILLNAYLANKQTTLTQKGGNMEQLYKGDGRLNMARSLQRAWQGRRSNGGKGDGGSIDEQRLLSEAGTDMEQLYQTRRKIQQKRRDIKADAGGGGTVVTGLRYQRAQHVIADSWQKFDTELRLKPGLDLAKIKAEKGAIDEFGQELVQMTEKVKSAELRQRLVEWQDKKNKVAE